MWIGASNGQIRLQALQVIMKQMFKPTSTWLFELLEMCQIISETKVVFQIGNHFEKKFARKVVLGI